MQQLFPTTNKTSTQSVMLPNEGIKVPTLSERIAKGLATGFNKAVASSPVQFLTKMGQGINRGYAAVAPIVTLGTVKPITPTTEYEKHVFGDTGGKPLTLTRAGAEWFGNEEKPKSMMSLSERIGYPMLAGATVAMDAMPGGKQVKSGVKVAAASDAVPQTKKLFQGLKDTSTKLLEKFKGMPEEITDQQFKEIVNTTKKEGLKKVDEDIIMSSLVRGDNGKINLTATSLNVQEKLVPLTPTPVKSPRYSYVGRDFLGDGKYGEMIYQSPIKTSAGDLHFRYRGYNSSNNFSDVADDSFPNYFSHVRFADMADGKTRKILETQSDLMQKEHFAEEVSRAKSGILHHMEENRNVYSLSTEEINEMSFIEKRLGANIPGDKERLKFLNKKAKDAQIAAVNARQKELTPLQSYNSNDPLAHLRTFREEVKRAAKDGKDTILIPNGETAMKIEGLVKRHTWTFNSRTENRRASFGDVVVGRELNDGRGKNWIITDVLGDGKFKAAPKDAVTGIERGGGLTEETKSLLERVTETFDISGKENTKHFVYKLNEEAIPKEAQRMGMQVERVSQDNGEWWKITNLNQYKDQPVSAFGKAQLGTLLAGAGATGGAAAIGNSIPDVQSQEQSQKKQLFKPQQQEKKKLFKSAPAYDREELREEIIYRENRGAEAAGKNLYNEVGVTGDLGKYQVSPDTLNTWSEPWLGKKYTKKEFLDDKDAQEKFWSEFANVVESYNLTKQEAIVLWHKGWGVLGMGGSKDEKKKKLKEQIKNWIENDDKAKAYLEAK